MTSAPSRRRARRTPLCGAALPAAFAVPGAHAQSTWPTGPIRFIVPFPAGSGTDVAARLLGERLSAPLGQPVIVDNTPGGDGSLAAEAAARSKPDSHPSLRVESVPDLVARAKANPGTLNFSSGSASSRVASERFKAKAGVDMTNVRDKGNPQPIADLTAGQVQAMFCDGGTALPQVHGGRGRALAVTSLAGTPEPIVTALNQKIVDIVRSPEFRAKTGPGADWAPGTPQQLAAFVDAEIAKWQRVAAQAKIEVE